MTVAERRQALLEWFYADEERSGMQTAQIAALAIYLPRGEFSRRWPARLYPTDRGFRHRAFRDLKALERDGHITRRQTNGKATWWYA